MQSFVKLSLDDILLKILTNCLFIFLNDLFIFFSNRAKPLSIKCLTEIRCSLQQHIEMEMKETEN
jgi:hypothetical protein